MCGLLIHRLWLAVHWDGINILNIWGAVLAAGHLYNAVRQEQAKLGEDGLSITDWPEMDTMMKLQGPNSWFYDANLPKTPEDYHRQWSRQVDFQLPPLPKILVVETGLHR